MSDSAHKPAWATMLDEMPVGRSQLVLCALLIGILVIDGIDIQLLSLVAPAIMEEWHVERSAFGPALAGALIGMSVGAVLGGALGDRLGRMPVLVASTALFGIATVLAGITNTISGMATLRIISGVGFGAAAPNAIALATDWLPSRHRSLMTSIMSIGTPAGGMIGASLVLAVLPAWGWRATFYACGSLTFAVALVALLAVRESPQWLVASGRLAKAAAVLRHMLSTDISLEPDRPSNSNPPEVKTTFLTRANLRLNIGAGLGFFSIAFVSYALVAWTAIMLTTIGFSLDSAVGALFAFNIAAVAAAVLAGLVMNLVGTRLTLALSSTLLLGAILLLMPVLADEAAARAGSTRVHLLIGSAGGFAGAAMASIYAIMANGYAVACRAGGLGFGMMLGRAGGILASFTGGYLLEFDGTAVWPFLSVLGGAAVIGVLCAFVADRHVPGRRETAPASMP